MLMWVLHKAHFEQNFEQHKQYMSDAFGGARTGALLFREGPPLRDQGQAGVICVHIDPGVTPDDPLNLLSILTLAAGGSSVLSGATRLSYVLSVCSLCCLYMISW